MLEVKSKAPSACTQQEIDRFRELAVTAGQINPQGLGHRIQRAKALLFLSSGNNLAGIAAVKIPNEEYHRDVFDKAGSQHPPAEFPFEIGWITVVEEYQGKQLSRTLVEAALHEANETNVFATSKVTNEKMHRTLLRYGFNMEGEPFDSRRANYQLRLYLRTEEGDVRAT